MNERMNGRERLEDRASLGPWQLFGIFLVVVAALSGAGYVFGWFGEAAKTAQDEFGPKAALSKYSWFVDQANAIEKMDKDIPMFEGRVTAVKTQYQGYGSDMAKWPPHIQAQYNQAVQQARDDLVAVASQRNNLVRDYNAASDKFNWSAFQTRPDKPKQRFHEYVAK